MTDANQDNQKETQDQNTDAQDPGINSVYRFLTYSLSIPERALRSTTAMVGGVLRESSNLLIPQAFRDSKSYKMFVDQMLDFATNDIGGVQSEEESATEVDGYVAKKTVSNFVELAGMATLHISPLTILAITSDLAYGSKTMLKELSSELKKQGVISEGSTIDSTADLLDAIGNTTSNTADAFDMPPLSVEGLKDTINKTAEHVATIDPTKMLPQSELQKLWDDIHDIAAEQKVDVFEISSAMTMYTINQVGNVAKGALTTVRVTGEMLNRHVFEHYWDALADIHHKGIYSFVGEVSGPYVEAVWHNFSTGRETLTEDIFSGKLIGKAWSGFRGWFQGVQPEDLDTIDQPDEP